MRRAVLAQEPPVQLDRPGAKTRPLRNPVVGVLAEGDLGSLGVGPVPGDDDPLNLRQPPVGVGLLLEPVRSEVPLTVRPDVARLELADVALLKPSSFLLTAAATRLTVPLSQCVLIGDSAIDIEAAHAATATAIGYANKPGKASTLKAYEPDAITTTMNLSSNL